MPVSHSWAYLQRRGINWVPMMFAYAFMYMGRYNLNVAKTALGAGMDKEQFGNIFGVGSVVYGASFLISGPLTDRIGGRLAMLWGVLGAILANTAIGVVIYGKSQLGWDVNLISWITVLYAVNMHFQSYGAVAIVTTKAPWFHLHERGLFSTIFGIGITFGIYFAFDWGYDILEATRAQVDPEKLGGWFSIAPLVHGVFGTGNKGHDENWMLFFIPAGLMAVCWVMMALWLRNTPGEAGFPDFDTGEASLSDSGERLPIGAALVRIFQHPVILWVCLIEFCSGILRNGIMQWYPIFADEVGFRKTFWVSSNWGLALFICGVVGAFGTGWVSDKFFNSRRAPVCGLFYGLMLVSTIVAVFTVDSPQLWYLGLATMVLSTAVIGVHGILSGTATADFGGARNTGIVVGVVDGLVYLGNGIQSFTLGRLTPNDDLAHQAGEWRWWPIFLVPFALAGFLMTLKIWHALPSPRTRTEKLDERVRERLAEAD